MDTDVVDYLNELLESHGFGAWFMEDEETITTPNGHTIESWDGVSPDGEESPLHTVLLMAERGYNAKGHI